jgi:hypothetical protein
MFVTNREQTLVNPVINSKSVLDLLKLKVMVRK